MAFQDFMKQLNINNNPLGPDQLVNVQGMVLPVGGFSLRSKERFNEISISNIISPVGLVVEHVRCGGVNDSLDSLKISAEIYRIMTEQSIRTDIGYDAIFHYKEKSVVVDLGTLEIELPYDVLDKEEYSIRTPELGNRVIKITETEELITGELARHYYSTYLKLASIVIRYRYLVTTQQTEHESLLKLHNSKNKAANLMDLINPSTFFDAYVTAHLRRAINIMSNKLLKGTEKEKSEVTESFRLSEMDGNPSVQILTEYSGGKATLYMLFQYLDSEDQTQSFWVNINNI